MNTDDHAILFLKSVIAKVCSGVGCDYGRGAGLTMACFVPAGCNRLGVTIATATPL